jgi:hypothetical protein
MRLDIVRKICSFVPENKHMLKDRILVDFVKNHTKPDKDRQG